MLKQPTDAHAHRLREVGIAMGMADYKLLLPSVADLACDARSLLSKIAETWWEPT